MIPAKSHSSAKVSFYPYTEDSSGEVCSAYAAAYMSLDHQVSYRDHMNFFFLFLGIHFALGIALGIHFPNVSRNVELKICGGYNLSQTSSFKCKLCINASVSMINLLLSFNRQLSSAGRKFRSIVTSTSSVF